MDSRVNNKKARLVLVGGFLGSGKTTLILELAKHLLKNGSKVGIVTNDQGSKLVDTEYLASQGLPVYDVKGGCFCCKFDQLAEKINALEEENRPDVILCEPIGSGIDLIATLLKPINGGEMGNFSLSPYCILVDPLRAKRYFEHSEKDRLTAIDYLFEQQLLEGDLIFLNKCDTLDSAEIAEISERLKAFNNASVMSGSVINKDGTAQLYQYLLGNVWQDRAALSIKCADKNNALSALSWLNATFKIAGTTSSTYGLHLLENIKKALKDKGSIAHIKAAITAGGETMKVSVVSDEDQPKVTGAATGSLFHVLLNARVQTKPELLERAVDQAIARTNTELKGRMLSYDSDCFAPNSGSCA